MPDDAAAGWKITLTSGKLIEIASILGVLGTGITFGWNYAGKPWAQTFINETVDDRIGAMERKLDILLNASRAETQQSIGEARTAEELARAAEELLCRVKAEQTGADPANCASAGRR